LRQYLNGDFYNGFSSADRNKIILRINQNKPNLWYGTNSGNSTQDYIFVLSLEEVDEYFGNSGDYLNKRRKNQMGDADENGWHLCNSYNSIRMLKTLNYTDSWWWLRSSGINSAGAACVYSNGSVGVGGNIVSDVGYVRPALWLQV